MSLYLAAIGVKAAKASGDEYAPVFGYYIQELVTDYSIHMNIEVGHF
jgi:hypothetical protein